MSKRIKHIGGSFLRIMIHASAEQKVDGKNTILTRKRMQNALHMTHIPQILRLEPWNIFTNDVELMQAVISASDYIETASSAVKIFMQLNATVLCFHSAFR